MIGRNMFSKRTRWKVNENSLTKLINEFRLANIEYIDLCLSNPTKCGFTLPGMLINVLSKNENSLYEPISKGLLTAREAICSYYSKQGFDIEIDNLFITASTSEAYSFIFKLICNPKDEVVIFVPGYPLLSYLSDLHDIKIREVRQVFVDGKWKIDRDQFDKNTTTRTKLIIVVNPNNPTGHYISDSDWEYILNKAIKNDIALVTDEVFNDYPVSWQGAPVSKIMEDRALVFNINGISKVLCLPQMKLGWIYISGPKELKNKACEKLDVIADTYLSPNTPVQNALGKWFDNIELIQAPVHQRILANYKYLQSIKSKKIDVLDVDAGWYGVLRLHNVEWDDEDFAFLLLAQRQVYIQPGYFFDFDESNYLVVSLLTEEEIFKKGIEKLCEGLE